jgi:hypothetical protein
LTDPDPEVEVPTSDRVTKGTEMARKKYTAEQIITKLREAEVELDATIMLKRHINGKLARDGQSGALQDPTLPNISSISTQGGGSWNAENC